MGRRRARLEGVGGQRDGGGGTGAEGGGDRAE